jgi:hypothetical protein
MCVEKTRGYVKNNKKKLLNAVVGWGRPVYTGEENAPLLNKVAASAPTPVKATSADAAKKSAKPAAKKSSGGGGKGSVAL